MGIIIYSLTIGIQVSRSYNANRAAAGRAAESSWSGKSDDESPFSYIIDLHVRCYKIHAELIGSTSVQLHTVVPTATVIWQYHALDIQ